MKQIISIIVHKISRVYLKAVCTRQTVSVISILRKHFVVSDFNNSPSASNILLCYNQRRGPAAFFLRLFVTCSKNRK